MPFLIGDLEEVPVKAAGCVADVDIHATESCHLPVQQPPLTTCTRGDLDQWLGSKPHRADRTASFVRWAVTHRHASRLVAPATRWTGPTEALDQDRRWADARQLLQDDTYPVADRVAGLLILLYAQKLSAITALTTQHVIAAVALVPLVAGLRIEASVTATVGRPIACRTDGRWRFAGRLG